MDERTLTALRGSIKKWDEIVAEEGSDEGSKNCPLCKAFPSFYCHGCPVKDTTGLYACEGSPYEQWFAHRIDEHGGYSGSIADCPDCLRLATAERDFLVSLLPPEAS